MKGDVSGVKCYRYHAGRDGNGTCNTVCQWWPKDKETKKPLDKLCPYWVPSELWDTPQDLPKNEEGKYTLLTIEEYETRYNTKVSIEEEGEVPYIPSGILIFQGVKA